MLLWNTNNPGKSTFATPYDSAHGMPTWAYLATIGILFFIVIRVWLAVKKSGKPLKKTRNKKDITNL